MAEIPAHEIRTGQRIRIEFDVEAVYQAGPPDGIVMLADGRRALVSVPVDRLVDVVPVCRACGCTDTSACEGGCVWVEDDLCSACSSPGVLDA